MFKIKRNQVIISALVVMIAVAGYLSYVDRKSGTLTADQFATTTQGDESALVLDNSSGQEVPVVNLNNQDQVANTDIANAAATANPVAAANSVGDNSAVNGVAAATASAAASPAAGTSLNNTTAGANNTTGLTSAGSDNSAAAPSTEPGQAVFVNSTSDSSYFVQAKLDQEQTRSKEKDLLTQMINSDNITSTQKTQCADELLTLQNRMEEESSSEAMILAKGFGDSFVSIDNTGVDVVVTQSSLTASEAAQITDIVTRKTGLAISQIKISPVKSVASGVASGE
jgi:stage III sporulation protein AH